MKLLPTILRQERLQRHNEGGSAGVVRTKMQRPLPVRNAVVVPAAAPTPLPIRAPPARAPISAPPPVPPPIHPRFRFLCEAPRATTFDVANGTCCCSMVTESRVKPSSPGWCKRPECLATVTWPLTGVPTGKTIWPSTATGSSMTASNRSPGMAEALESDSCMRAGHAGMVSSVGA